jgi:hypothetical protein
LVVLLVRFAILRGRLSGGLWTILTIDDGDRSSWWLAVAAGATVAPGRLVEWI